MHDDARAAVNWARHILDRDPLFLDLETTGTGPGAEVVDVGIVDRGGNVVYESLIRPQGAIPAEASAIHGIDDHDVADAPSWVDAYGHILAAVNGKAVIIYNLAFDSKIIRQECHRAHLFPPRTHDWHCAMLRYAAFVGERTRKGDYKWHRLDRAVAAMGVELPPQTHRAVDDSLYTLRLVEALAKIELPALARPLL